MKRAFVIEACKVPVERAAVHGVLTYLWSGSDRRSSIWSPAFGEELTARLADVEFNHDEDMLVVAGDTVPIVIAVAKIVAMYGHVKVLFWDASSREYRPRVVGDEYSPVNTALHDRKAI